LDRTASKCHPDGARGVDCVRIFEFA